MATLVDAIFVLTNIEQEDYEILMSRVVRPGNIGESLRNSPWNTATMLVFRNEVRTHKNNLSVFNFALQTHQPLIVIVAMDQIHSRTATFPTFITGQQNGRIAWTFARCTKYARDDHTQYCD